MNYVPYVIDNTNGHEYHSDLFSRLLSSRIIILSGEVDDDMASLAVAQLLYLESLNPRILEKTSTCISTARAAL